MKAFTELHLGFSNAENYRKRANKELLEKYFVKDQYLEQLLDPNVYFLVGEKGTGKTTYSTYLSNNKYKEKNGFTYDVRQTEYQKFLELKRLGHLPLSQYSEVWRTLFLILAATSILEKSSTPSFLRKFTQLGVLKKAIDEFYNNAFSPEIVKVLNFVESSGLSSSLIAKFKDLDAGVSSNRTLTVTDSKTTFQTNLLVLRKHFEEALSAVKLEEDYIIFIDGIDVRPSEIAYDDYFDCVRGIIEAIWSINNDFLADIKGSKGRIRFVLLVRPDIFLRAGLHNSNTKIRDNSVLLNWRTTYKDFKTSSLFAVANKMLSSQNDQSLPVGKAWDYYFPFQADSTRYIEFESESPSKINSFISFLRFSYYRPRDINAMMGTMQTILLARGTVQTVQRSDFDDPSFRDAHADYLLGELRDQLLFYYTQDDIELFLQFFAHLNGKKKFSYDEFLEALKSFVSECEKSAKKLPKFFDSAEIFLQFLFEQNVVCYIERDDQNEHAEPFIRWCFRERTPSNLSPKVRTHVDYEIFYGLAKSLNVGRSIRRNISTQRLEIGTIIKLTPEKKFGFLRGGSEQLEYYFRYESLNSDFSPRIGDRVSFELSIKYGKTRATSIKKA